MTDILTWTATLATHVDEMDKEHQTLINLMNKLNKLCKDKAPKSEIGKALEELGAFTVKHFSDEEQYMQSINFSQLSTHKIHHKQLLERFTEHATNFKNGPQSVLPDEFFEFLKFWLTTHIMHIDQKYSPAQ